MAGELIYDTSYDVVVISSGGSLGNDGYELSAAVDNSSAGKGYTYLALGFSGSFSVAPTAGRTVEAYVVTTVSGSVYEDATSTTVLPARGPDAQFSLRAVTTTQLISARPMLIPIYGNDFKVMVRNRGGQTLGSGWQLYGRLWRHKVT